MTNLYVFWKLVADPPDPWVRLTRTDNYIRLASDTASHWTQTGSATHSGTMTSVTIGNSNSVIITGSGTTPLMSNHNHPAPSSWSINTNNNNPPSYGLDIIYMDLTAWEAGERRFPTGAVLVSNGVLTDANISRFTAADGYYIVNNTPGTIAGTSTPQSHTCSGTTGNYSTSVNRKTFGPADPYYTQVGVDHVHSISLSTDAVFAEPRNLVTRLYEVLSTTSKAFQETVVFVDGSVGSYWEILTGWSGANLKAGNSNPTLAGSDTHTQSISGNTSAYANGGGGGNRDSGYSVIYSPHAHSVTGTISATSHVPISRQLVPAKLKTTLMHVQDSDNPQIVGLLW